MDKFKILTDMVNDADLLFDVTTEHTVAIANLHWLLGVIETLSAIPGAPESDSKAL